MREWTYFSVVYARSITVFSMLSISIFSMMCVFIFLFYISLSLVLFMDRFV